MNIFVLDRDPEKCAQYHCDKHVVKMILETAQIVCTASSLILEEEIGKNDKDAFLLSGVKDTIPYKPTHKNHPSVIWARKSSGNFLWLLDLGFKLSEEYTKRYSKNHKSTEVLRKISSMFDQYLTELIPQSSLLSFEMTMPDEYKGEDPIEAYRVYYAGEKSEIAKWNKSTKEPNWFTTLK